MIYDLNNPFHRKQFIRYANRLLKSRCRTAELRNEAKRTINQNSYLHVLLRIMATETGVTENYSKEVYFKQLANPDIFFVDTLDPVKNVTVRHLRSTSDLTIQEMSAAISNFRHWADDEGYYLPEADSDDDGNITFASPEDEATYIQADVETRRMASQIGIKE